MPIDPYLVLIYPLLFIFPAYAANGIPVLMGGGKPLDGGRKINGRRLFGNNKTIRGTASSIAAGVVVGLLEYPVAHYLLYTAILLTLGANFGDLAGSFIKRRIDMKPGMSLPLLDQYGFFIAALAFDYPVGHYPDLYGMLFITVVTGLLHVLTNRGAYALKLKSVPW